MKRILIIENDPLVLNELATALAAEQFVTETVRDGADGIALVRRGKFDIVLIGHALPTKSGEEICAQLRKEKIYIPILMLTAQIGETEKVMGLAAGADDYVTKPINVRELIARIHEQLAI
jgi:DNA-binding response OmpR family regulator